jgi:pyruvate oxidase
VVQLPVDLGYQNIPKQQIYSTAKNYRPTPHPTLNESDIDQAVAMLKKAKRPLIYAGIGTRGAEAEVRRFAEKIKAPIITTGIAIDVIPNATPYWLGSVNRVGMKASNEAIAQADTVLFVGNNYPFAEVTNIFKHIQQFIQIDIDASHLGKRHLADVAILGDAKEAILALTEKVEDVPETPWWKANIENNQNWQEYLHHLEEKTEGEIELYQVYRGIRSIMEEDAILSVDVGDVTQTSVRHLHLNGKQKWRTSALFATMGVGVPGAIAAKLDFPSKQVLSLSGDGAFNMVMQDLKTQVQYRLPIINVVFSNRQFGFIKDEQEETNSGYIGVQFEDIDYAMVGVAMGATSFKITDASDVEEVFQKAREAQLNGETVLIDAKIKQDRPIPTESLVLDDVKFTPYEVAKFKTRYKAKNLHPFRYFLEKNGLSYEDRITELGGF